MGKKDMVRAQSDSAAVAVSGLNLGTRLVGRWTLDLNPPGQRNVVPSGPRAQSSELNPIKPTRRGTLTLVWVWRSAFTTR